MNYMTKYLLPLVNFSIWNFLIHLLITWWDLYLIPIEGIENCLSRSRLPSLDYLGLSSNQLSGKLPNWLGQHENLVHLDLASNLFNGILAVSLGQLSELVNLDVSSNKLIGILAESHFSKLTKQKSLQLGPNSFTLNVNSNWVPPFQLQDLYMGNCYLGTSIPAWL